MDLQHICPFHLQTAIDGKGIQYNRLQLFLRLLHQRLNAERLFVLGILYRAIIILSASGFWLEVLVFSSIFTSNILINASNNYIIQKSTTGFNLTYLHSGAKCLVWVKKCCHIWHDQLVLLTNKLWLVLMGMKQKKKNLTQKNWVFQNYQFSILICESLMNTVATAFYVLKLSIDTFLKNVSLCSIEYWLPLLWQQSLHLGGPL